MTNAIAERPAARRRPGGVSLSQVLHDSQELSRLREFCCANVCTPAEVSTDGIHLDINRVFALMRRRGWTISAPTRAARQPGRAPAWQVHIQLPNGPSFDMAFYNDNFALEARKEKR